MSLGMTTDTLTDILTHSQQRGMNDGPFRPPTRLPPNKADTKGKHSSSSSAALRHCCLDLAGLPSGKSLGQDFPQDKQEVIGFIAFHAEGIIAKTSSSTQPYIPV